MVGLRIKRSRIKNKRIKQQTNLTVGARALSVVALKDVVVLRARHVLTIPGVPAFLRHNGDCNIHYYLSVLTVKH